AAPGAAAGIAQPGAGQAARTVRGGAGRRLGPDPCTVAGASPPGGWLRQCLPPPAIASILQEPADGPRTTATGNPAPVAAAAAAGGLGGRGGVHGRGGGPPPHRRPAAAAGGLARARVDGGGMAPAGLRHV